MALLAELITYDMSGAYKHVAPTALPTRDDHLRGFRLVVGQINHFARFCANLAPLGAKCL
jgi:hypothetical protein